MSLLFSPIEVALMFGLYKFFQFCEAKVLMGIDFLTKSWILKRENFPDIRVCYTYSNTSLPSSVIWISCFSMSGTSIVIMILSLRYAHLRAGNCLKEILLSFSVDFHLHFFIVLDHFSFKFDSTLLIDKISKGFWG